jgi:hypothetical protein
VYLFSRAITSRGLWDPSANGQARHADLPLRAGPPYLIHRAASPRRLSYAASDPGRSLDMGAGPGIEVARGLASPFQLHGQPGRVSGSLDMLRLYHVRSKDKGTP